MQHRCWGNGGTPHQDEGPHFWARSHYWLKQHDAELALKLKPLIAAKAKKNQGTRTDISQKSVESHDTQKELARAAGVSHDTNSSQ